MTEAPKRRGGARPGAGRKPVAPDQRLRSLTVRLTAGHIMAASALGDGEVGRGVRVAIERVSAPPVDHVAPPRKNKGRL